MNKYTYPILAIFICWGTYSLAGQGVAIIGLSVNIVEEDSAYTALDNCLDDCEELERIVAECLENNTPPEDCTI